MMDKIYRDLMRKIEEEEEKFGGKMQPPATDEEIRILNNEVVKRFRVKVPNEYQEFLQIHNGLNWNGLFIYSTHINEAKTNSSYINGFVYENEGYRIDDSRFNDLLVFGDDDMSFYIYRISSSEYQVLDKIPLDVMGNFPTFDEMIYETLNSKF